jgi:WD40 repeat protein
MFACQEQNDVCVFRFFTGERPAAYRFSCHKGPLLDIQWKQDDTGLVSTSEDKTIQVWDLKDNKPVWSEVGDEANNLIGYFRSYTTSFTSV